MLTRYGHYEDIPPKASAWEVPGIGGSRAMTLAATLRDHWDEALLYRDLARLRTVEDGVPIRQTDPDELRWDGAPRAEWEAFCEEWGLDRLRSRPHRWLARTDEARQSFGTVRCHVSESSVAESSWYPLHRREVDDLGRRVGAGNDQQLGPVRREEAADASR